MSIVTERSFAGGEISPALYSRVDTSKYAAGLRTCRNTIIPRSGGSQNRPGTYFDAEVKDSTQPVRLIPFIFNSTQTAVLEFGYQYMRIHQNGAPLQVPGIAAYDPSAFYSPGDFCSSGGINYVCVSSVHTIGPPNTTYWMALSGSTFELPTPYQTADLATLHFAQSGDIIRIVHPLYLPMDLSRLSATHWTLTLTSLVPPTTTVPTVFSMSPYSAGSAVEYTVTFLGHPTDVEPLPIGYSYTNGVVPTATAPVTLTITGGSSLGQWRIYRKLNGVFGFLGIAGGASATYVDYGITPDVSIQPPSGSNPFAGSGNQPSTVAYVQQRLVFACSNNNPLAVWMSQSGQYNYFFLNIPTKDSDSVFFQLSGKQISPIRSIIEVGKGLVFTDSGEHSIDGDAAGTIKPTAINVRQHTFNGSGYLQPLIVSGNAIFVQARGSIIRDFGFDFQVDGYRGNDLTVFASHLVDGYTIVDWAYQQVPNSIIWCVRSDGVLLGLTYIKEQQILAWHRHDFDGVVENVCCVPEGKEDALYIVVRRMINGTSKRYVERFQSRAVNNIVDSIFMDCALTYDGRNNSSWTMAISGGSTWAYDETLTLTASNAFFSSGDVGSQIVLTGADGSLVRFTIGAYTSSTVVTGNADRTVPASLRTTAVTSWSKAVKNISGLGQIEGKKVSILADGFVVASPNNAAYPVYTVTSGALTLDQPYSVIHVGLPYISDLETLDIDSANGETLADKDKQVSKLTARVDKSRGLWVGAEAPSNDLIDPLQGMTELKIRQNEGYDSPVALESGVVDVILQSEWNSNGRIFVRQVDPLPLAVLSVSPAGLFPLKQGG